MMRSKIVVYIPLFIFDNLIRLGKSSIIFLPMLICLVNKLKYTFFDGARSWIIASIVLTLCSKTCRFILSNSGEIISTALWIALWRSNAVRDMSLRDSSTCISSACKIHSAGFSKIPRLKHILTLSGRVFNLLKLTTLWLNVLRWKTTNCMSLSTHIVANIYCSEPARFIRILANAPTCTYTIQTHWKFLGVSKLALLQAVHSGTSSSLGNMMLVYSHANTNINDQKYQAHYR